MLSSVVDFFRDRYLPPYCDCCNHNFEILSLESESSGDSASRNFLRQGLASFKRWTSEVMVKPLIAKERKASTKQRIKKFFQLGKIIGRETKHVKSDQMIARNESGRESCLDCSKSNIYTDMGSIFASIAESDKPLQKEPNSPMICFLIHLASDLNIQGPFLSRLHRLPADVTQTDGLSSLSCASTWLQSSLVLIRDSYSPDSTPLDLQLPFVVLETEYQRARARATALQQQCPDEQVVTATLDLAVLKAAKLVTSAEHAFRMLRVPMESVDFSQRLLV
ncbi:hypothetical protein C7974DRAFT_376348 [Boeremia exigua]|uniref:uncharacterized protein n=1 Tax=Boeremia exigua TaxID=749465 RepID=UPI001E8D307F|nr:uncharacterized protein C7974DRAFT_376348 [Boeremia exigua]KAH6629515.1 hypothetical protein C7974DRAFT_376348 [Boeremia exigua]